MVGTKQEDSMPYTVKAIRPVEEKHECADLAAAHNKATELENAGCTVTAIIDPKGQDVSDTGEADQFNQDN